jgi:hypothetical protein
MNKLRCDSHWSRLDKKQTGRLEQWLFDDGLTYEEVLRRAKEELDVTASLSSLKRYRQWATQKHLLYQLTDGTAIARCPKRADGTRKYSHAMASRLAGMRAMDMFLGNPKQERNLIAMMRLLIRDGAVAGQAENMAATREFQRENLKIKREIAGFEVMKFSMRNQLRAKKLEMKASKNSPPASASARVFPEEKNLRKADRREAPKANDQGSTELQS